MSVSNPDISAYDGSEGQEHMGRRYPSWAVRGLVGSGQREEDAKTQVCPRGTVRAEGCRARRQEEEVYDVCLEGPLGPEL